VANKWILNCRNLQPYEAKMAMIASDSLNPEKDVAKCSVVLIMLNPVFCYGD
jgi:hypothetical protein